MEDVVYRIVDSSPVIQGGTITANNGNPISMSYDRTNEKTISDEHAAGSGLVDRFDDPTFYQS